MVLLVPFDGSALAEAALSRAVEFGALTGEPVLVVTVFPADEGFARERGWIDSEESYDPAAVADRFEARVGELAPEATFRAEHVDAESMRAWAAVDVSRTVREVAAEVDASIVFVGSENAGRVTTPITSVGTPVSEDPRYDVHIVRHIHE